LPVVVLDEELASLFGRLGVQTVGEVAALGADRLVERFGTRGHWLYALSSGRDPRPVTARTPPPELHREVAFEPPVETADQIAFALRVPAAEFVSRLGAQGLVCTELRVVLTGDRGERSERVWLHPGAFDAAAVVDRVRWQLAEQGPARRCAVESPARTAAQPWRGADRTRGGGCRRPPHRTSVRVGTRGARAPRTLPRTGDARPSGRADPGRRRRRWLSERQRLVPWGDVAGDLQAERPWPPSGSAALGGVRRGCRWRCSTTAT
jgi:protein ImuB